MTSDETLVKVLRTGTLLKFKLPLRYSTLIVGGLGQQNRIDKASNFRIRQWKLRLTEFATNGDYCIVFVCIGINSAGLANGQSRD